jgi:hypothetical protein
MKILILNLFIFISALGVSLETNAGEMKDDFNPPKQDTKTLIIEKYLLSALTLHGLNLAKDLHEDVIYDEFVSGLKFRTSSSLEVSRIIKLAAENFEVQYRNEKDFNTQSKILTALDRLTHNGITYAIKTNNILLQNYLLKFTQVVGAENYLRVEKSDTTRTGYVPDRNKQADVFNIKVKTAVKRLIEGIHPADPTLDFRRTKLELSFREITAEESENIFFIVPKKERKKVFTFKIIEPTVDSAEAALLTTKALLANESVEGVYFEDRVRIPSKLQSSSFEVSLLGSNVLLKRPSCAKLFQ